MNPELDEVIRYHIGIATVPGYALTWRDDDKRSEQDAIIKITSILRFVWDMRVSADAILAFGTDRVLDGYFPSVASYLRYVYYELSANNQVILDDIREWIATHK